MATTGRLVCSWATQAVNPDSRVEEEVAAGCSKHDVKGKKSGGGMGRGINTAFVERGFAAHNDAVTFPEDLGHGFQDIGDYLCRLNVGCKSDDGYSGDLGERDHFCC
jgi:hypothetical protein